MNNNRIKIEIETSRYITAVFIYIYRYDELHQWMRFGITNTILRFNKLTDKLDDYGFTINGNNIKVFEI